MTQPDGHLPESSANYSSLAALAAKTQEEWEAELYGRSTQGLQTFLDAMFGGLPHDLREGVEYTRAMLTALARKLLGDPDLTLPTLGDVLTALGVRVDSQTANFLALFGIDVNQSPDTFNPLQAFFVGATKDGQDLIDAIWQAITHFTDTNKLITDVSDALRNIPGLNILGLGGPADLWQTVQTTWDQIISGLVGEVGTGASLADLFNITYQVSSSSALGRMGWDILGIRSNKSLFTGFSQTSTSNLNMASLAFAKSGGVPTAPTVPVTQAAALTSYHRVEESIDVQMVGWTGYGIDSMTAFYVNLWTMDPNTGARALQHHSGNLVGLLSPSMQDNIYDMPVAVHLEPGDLFGIELHPVGSGTHHVVGDQTWRNFDHPTAFPRRWSSKRNAGTSSAAPASPVADADIDYATTYVPFVEYGIKSTNVARPHSDDVRYYGTVGAWTVVIPLWCNVIDIVGVGAGGGGQGCGILWGEGGHAGVWNSSRVTRGVDIPMGTETLTVAVAAGGAGHDGLLGDPGDPGGAATVSGAGWAGFSAPGGAGGSLSNLDIAGKSPGNYVFDGVTYAGGAAANTISGRGNAPGGGGAAATISFTNGGNGAPGAIWLIFRQMPLDTSDSTTRLPFTLPATL